MSPDGVFLVLGAVLFPLALHALFVRRNLVMRVVAVNVAASSAFLILVAASGATAEGEADPVAQALVVTGIVISLSLSAFALSLIRRIADETGRADLRADDDHV